MQVLINATIGAAFAILIIAIVWEINAIQNRAEPRLWKNTPFGVVLFLWGMQAAIFLMLTGAFAFSQRELTFDDYGVFGLLLLACLTLVLWANHIRRNTWPTPVTAKYHFPSLLTEELEGMKQGAESELSKRTQA